MPAAKSLTSVAYFCLSILSDLTEQADVHSLTIVHPSFNGQVLIVIISNIWLFFLCKKFLQGLFSSSKPYTQSYMDDQQQKEKKDDDDGPQGK